MVFWRESLNFAMASPLLVKAWNLTFWAGQGEKLREKNHWTT
jgi:hypothetical protein